MKNPNPSAANVVLPVSKTIAPGVSFPLHTQLPSLDESVFRIAWSMAAPSRRYHWCNRRRSSRGITFGVVYGVPQSPYFSFFLLLKNNTSPSCSILSITRPPKILGGERQLATRRRDHPRPVRARRPRPHGASWTPDTPLTA